MFKFFERRTNRLLLVWMCMLFGGLAGPAPVGAQDAPEDNLQFANELVEMGFPDYADKVINELLRTDPSLKERAKSVQVQILIALKKYAEAEAIMESLPKGNPKADAVRLAIANSYYRVGENEKAREIYSAFFKEYEGKDITDPDLRRFYADAAYRYAQMQEFAGNVKAALQGYENVLKVNPEENVARAMMHDMAVLYIKLAMEDAGNRSSYLQRARALCEEVMWKGIDIWFGKCTPLLAHIYLLEGNRKDAEQTILTNMDILKQVDQALRQEGVPMDESPMASVRFMLGELYKQQAEELAAAGDSGAIKQYGQALQEYYNVFAKYGGSKWGPIAGEKAQEIKELLETKYDRTVNVDLGKYAGKAASAQLDRANMLFREKKYDEAAAEYLRIMNQYPDADLTRSFVSLIQCYIKTTNNLYTRVTLEYMSERFHGNENAATAMLIAGKHFFDQGDIKQYQKAYDLFVDGFPEHDRAPLVLYSMAVAMNQQDRTEEYLEYLQRIVDNYPESEYYPKAINLLAWSYYVGQQYEKAIEVFRKYLKETVPSAEQARAQYSLADCLMRTQRYIEALKEYSAFKKMVEPEDNPYAQTEEEQKKNRELLAKAEFYMGYVMTRITEPEDKIPAFRKFAVQQFTSFLERYPDNEFAPRALSALGRIQLEEGDYDRATETFNQLAAKYPNSSEGKSALYSLIKAAMQIKSYDIAKDALKKMLANPSKYSTDQFALIGKWMLNAELYEEAMKAYERVTASGTEERKLLEPALFGLGKAYMKTLRYDEALDALNRLMEKYPQSALFYDTKFLLGQGYREMERIDDAVLALEDVFKFAQDPLLRTKADYELGMIYKAGGKNDEALASFQRVALLADPDDPEFRDLVESCLFESLDLFAAVGKYKELLEAADRYLTLFADDGKHIQAVRKKQADARLKASTQESAGTSP